MQSTRKSHLLCHCMQAASTSLTKHFYPAQSASGCTLPLNINTDLFVGFHSLIYWCHLYDCLGVNLMFPRPVYQSPLNAALAVYQSPLNAAPAVYQSPLNAAPVVYQSPLNAAPAVYQSPLNAAPAVYQSPLNAVPACCCRGQQQRADSRPALTPALSAASTLSV